MENDNISPSSSESKLPLIVGILGFALGTAGLVLGIKAKGAAQAASDEAAAAKISVGELGNALSGKASTADLQVVRADLDAGLAAANANDKTFGEQIATLQKLATSPKATTGAGKAAVAAGPGEYVVTKGDTLGGIAKKVGISLKSIQELNPDVNANRMQIGQKLKTK
jgi:LysM repeat protein